MDAFGGDSPLSDAPSINSPSGSTGTASPPKQPPPLKVKATSKKPLESASSSSRRSSRIGSRSISPDKPSAVNNGLKIKIQRPPSPERLAEIVAEQGGEGLTEEKEKGTGKRGKKRKSEGRAEEEVREAIANGKGKKKAKVSHDTAPIQGEGEDLEPKKRGVAQIKKKGTVQSGKSSADLITDLFGSDDDDDAEAAVVGGEEPVEEEKKVTKTTIKIKRKPGPKPKTKPILEEDTGADGNDNMDEIVAAEQRSLSPVQASDSKSRQQDDADKLDTEAAPSTEIKSKSKRIKRDTNEDTTTATQEPSTSAGKATKTKGKPKKSVEGESTSTSTTTSTAAATAKDHKGKPTPPAPEIDMKPTKEDAVPGSIPATTVKPKKSFAQAVAGSPPPQEKRDKKPLPTITKLAKSTSTAAVATPDKRISSTGSGTGTGTGTNTPTTTAAKKIVPVPKKKEVSLLESTMASLLGGGPKATPKKEEKDISKSRSTPIHTPKITKEVRKGGWSDTWILTPQQQREVMESRDEREEERRKRMSYRNNPVNLQEAKDSYRLDSTKSRVIPSLPYPFGGLGVKTEKAPSMMLQALIERNQSKTPGQSV